jgi:hypothetical protein
MVDRGEEEEDDDDDDDREDGARVGKLGLEDSYSETEGSGMLDDV